jgi:hypothetical protein
VDNGKAILLTDLMRKSDDYAGSIARALGLLRHTMHKFPGKPRIFVLDIEGHRNGEGGWDADALDYQHALTGVLAQWFTEVQVPLIHIKINGPQREDDIDGLVDLEPGDPRQGQTVEMADDTPNVIRAEVP